MTLLRSDAEVALNDLLVNCRKVAAQYRDSADHLEGRTSSVLAQLAEEHDGASRRLEQAIYRHGDLPSGTNEDRETLEQLYHRVHARLSEDEEADLVQQLLQLEQAFGQRLAELIASEQVGSDTDLLHDLLKQTRVAVARLHELSAAHGSRRH